MCERERERERDSIIVFGGQIYYMTYGTKNITFHVIRVKVSSKSWCSRTLPMNVAIESAHCVVREICAKIGLGRRCVESMVEYNQRQSIVSKYDTQTLGLV